MMSDNTMHYDPYEKFKDELTFDKLCQSLGDLFKEFFLLHQKGEEDKILEKLKSVKKSLKKKKGERS